MARRRSTTLSSAGTSAKECPNINGYRMIGRIDGKFAGGVLPFTDEMKQHGARPIWLGYILVPDVDAALEAIKQAGGKTLMPATDIPQCRPDRDGDRSAGRAFLHHEAEAARGRSRREERRLLVEQPQRVRWNELSTSDPERRIDFYRASSAGNRKARCRWARWATTASSRPMASTSARSCASRRSCRSASGPITLALTTSTGPLPRSPMAAARCSMGRMEIPGGEFALNGIDPQGASVRPGRPAQVTRSKTCLTN